MAQSPALLMLDDGTCFEGKACGACKEAAGEVVFTTAMSGYQETLTDPSYYGQIVVFTAAHTGNYGTTPLDTESSAPGAAGAVFHELFSGHSTSALAHWRSEESLDARLARAGISSIQGVDTRELTLHLREHGARNGLISALDLDRPSLLRRAKALPPMQGQDFTTKVSCQSPYTFTPSTGCTPQDIPPLHVAVVDYGVKRSILAQLARHGMQPTVWPAAAPAKDILAAKPDGVLLSNGPGDPAACTQAIATTKQLLGRVPLFGICLGHQILGLSLGAQTHKLVFGHHGVNHPVKDLRTGRVLITSQNHGFCIDAQSLPAAVKASHWNLNDHSLEGLECRDIPAFSVQFHPEAAPGPTDAVNLFARFRQLVEAAL